MSELAERLAVETLALVDVASVSRDERAILGLIRERLAAVPGLRVTDHTDAVVVVMPEARMPTARNRIAPS